MEYRESSKGFNSPAGERQKKISVLTGSSWTHHI